MPRPSLEIVTHCWRYDRLLTYQLSSLVLYPPTLIDYKISVFYAMEDQSTIEVLNWFRNHVPIQAWPLPLTHLFNRAIGRNEAAVVSRSDWVWFTDCDYLFREGCLDAIAGFEPGAYMRHPAMTNKSRSLAIGDTQIGRVGSPGIYDIDVSEFEPIRNSRPIGGIQIVPHEIAKRGYQGCRKQPLPPVQWKRTKSDFQYRRWVAKNYSRHKREDVPQLYRIRHTEIGRASVTARN